ncbi:MAG: right-handed parallel beta-helix repeat-containing protein [Bacteroidales bacterium]
MNDYHLKRLSKYILLVLTVFFISCGTENEIHVSPDGDDSSAGNEEAPLKTLGKAQDELKDRLSEMKQGTLRVLLHDGTYTLQKPLTFNEDFGGHKNIEIIWQAVQGAEPVISGAKSMKLETTTEICSLSFSGPKELFDLYVNGKRARRARTPDSGFFRFENVEEEIIEKGDGRVPEKAEQQLFFPEKATADLLDLSFPKLQDVRFHAFFKWDNTIRYLSGKSEKAGVFKTRGTGMKPWNPMKEGTRFFLENYKDALDAPGEWYASKSNGQSKLYYIPKEEEKGQNLNFNIPVTDKLLVIKGTPEEKVKNITFEGIRFHHSNYNLPRSGFEPAQAANTIGAALEIDHAENIVFEDCEIAHTGQHGIWFRKGTNDCVMKRCYVHDLGAGGVRIGDTQIPEDSSNLTENIQVENCIIQGGGYNFPSGVGVWIGQSGNNRILHNDIGNFRYSGVSVGWVWGYSHSPAKYNKIKYNRIHHIGWALLSDMAGVYTLGKSEGTQINNNVVHDIHAYSYGGWGLYTDEGSSDITMKNNLVYNTKTGGFHQHYGRENNITNNIFAFADMYQVQATRVEDHRSFTFENNIVVGREGEMLAGPWKEIGVKMDSNCYWYNERKSFDFVGLSFEKWKARTGHDQNSIIADPGTINTNEGTFTLNDGISEKIGFVPFDPEEAGVYGSAEWKEKALLPDSVINEFDRTVKRNMQKQ